MASGSAGTDQRRGYAGKDRIGFSDAAPRPSAATVLPRVFSHCKRSHGTIGNRSRPGGRCQCLLAEAVVLRIVCYSGTTVERGVSSQWWFIRSKSSYLVAFQLSQLLSNSSQMTVQSRQTCLVPVPLLVTSSKSLCSQSPFSSVKSLEHRVPPRMYPAQ